MHSDTGVFLLRENPLSQLEMLQIPAPGIVCLSDFFQPNFVSHEKRVSFDKIAHHFDLLAATWPEHFENKFQPCRVMLVSGVLFSLEKV